MSRLLAVTSFLAFAFVVTPSVAQEEDRDAQRRKQELESLSSNLKPVAPEPGRETAPLRAPPWCGTTKAEGYGIGSIGRSIEASQKNGWMDLIQAARIVCNWPTEPAVQKGAQIIAQTWINITGLSDADAVESLKMRMDDARQKSDQAKLCGELVVSDEISGEEKAFMQARRLLFGCHLSPDSPLWGDTSAHMPDELVTYTDVSAVEPDELVKLAVVLDKSAFAMGEHGIYFDQRLASYVTDQVDLHTFAAPKALAMAEQPPFKGNVFARTIIVESVGRAKMGIAAVEAVVQKKSSDADWKELLVTAPMRGIAAWTKAAQANKDVLARSNEFEHKMWGPSRKALKGCWPVLRKDFLGVAKTLKHGTEVEFREAMSDPIASLLFMRLAACAAYDGTDKHYAETLLRLANDLRFARGPRTAAYYSALDALGQINDDRPKFPIHQKEFHFFKNNAVYSEAFGAANEKRSGMGFVGDGGKGTVKSIKKGAGGAVIEFVTTKHTEMGRSCVETGHILTFRADGSPLYYQKCHDTGPLSIYDTPGAITVPAEWAESIAVGSVLEFSAMIGKAPARTGLPKAVYSDKSKKKLINYYGLPL